MLQAKYILAQGKPRWKPPSKPQLQSPTQLHSPAEKWLRQPGQPQKKTQPQAKRFALSLAGHIRDLLSTKRGRRGGVIALSIITIIFIAVLFQIRAQRRNAWLLQRYNNAYRQLTQAQEEYANGDTPAATSTAQNAKKELSSLSASRSSVDSILKHSPSLKPNEPRTVAALESQIAQLSDQISGLLEVKYTTIVDFTSTNETPEHFELYNGKAYLFDSSGSNSLSIFNFTTGKTTTSRSPTSEIGVVKYTSLSYDNSGIYILSDKGIWFYRFSNDSLISVSPAFTEWPKSQAVASYLNNLYLLSDNVVYKYTKTASGFSPAIKSVSLENPSDSARALAVDGSIYAINSSELLRYSSGNLIDTAKTPSGFGTATGLRSTNNSETILATSNHSNRIAVWATTNNKLVFSKEIELAGVSHLYDSSYDAATSTYYAIVDHRLVSFKL